MAGQTKQSPKNKSAAGDATRRHFPTVFGIILGDEIIHQMPNCGNERADRCFEEMNQASWADVFLAGASSMAGAWQPAVAGNPVRIEGFSMPDWVAPLAPVVGSLGGNMWNDMLLAVQVRASGIHPDFRDDLVGKFGPPLREGKKSFRNAYGKVWSAPMLEWQSSELHVQFVPDDKQDDEAGWGVLLIETDAAYKARKEFEAKQRAERVKP